MLCLPQAFELFLKNLVGGLHTVYTKCKRLEISPIVCNVEQVRVLRSEVKKRTYLGHEPALDKLVPYRETDIQTNISIPWAPVGAKNVWIPPPNPTNSVEGIWSCFRGLGAILPGVNRCKLLSDQDFDELYKDCTTQRWASDHFIINRGQSEIRSTPCWARAIQARSINPRPKL